ncbi:MAG: alpha/beta fold hydrolase [Microthrixaceae bacterium]
MLQLPVPDGALLTIHDLGGSTRPTLLCHATGFHGAVWEPLASALGPDLRRWSLDFRAHGRSTRPAGTGLAWPAFADDVLAVIDGLHLAVGEVLGVGHSMGGAALLLAEQARPGTFAGIWAFEPITPPPGALPPPEGGNSLADGAARRRATFPSHADALANFASKPPLNALRADALHAYVRHGFVAGEHGQVDLACRPVDESEIYRGGGAHDAFARLDRVTCPVVVACGRAEPGPALFAPLVAAALPAGRLERIEPLGHFGPLEAPEICAASIERFASTLAVTPRA